MHDWPLITDWLIVDLGGKKTFRDFTVIYPTTARRSSQTGLVWSLNGFRVNVFEAYMVENSIELREFRFPEIKLTMTLKGLQGHEDIAVVGQICA